MSERIKLGELIEFPEERDAVHVAIAPVIAAEPLKPGTHVGFTDENRRVGKVRNPIGIADPFLKSVIAEGQEFWLLLYPNTITGMRHHWEHPAFKDTEKDKVELAKLWLTDFADYLDMTYTQLMEALTNYVENGRGYTLGFDTPDRVYEDVDTMWTHYYCITGKLPPSEGDVIFRCAC